MRAVPQCFRGLARLGHLEEIIELVVSPAASKQLHICIGGVPKSRLYFGWSGIICNSGHGRRTGRVKVLPQHQTASLWVSSCFWTARAQRQTDFGDDGSLIHHAKLVQCFQSEVLVMPSAVDRRLWRCGWAWNIPERNLTPISAPISR